MEEVEILGLGVVAVDDICSVEAFPLPDTKQRMRSFRRFCGGQTATALVAASRLGCSCFWCGHLGHNELSNFARDMFIREKVGIIQEVTQPDAEPVHSILISDMRDGSRTIMWDEDHFRPLAVGPFETAMLDRAKCLFVDQGSPAEQVAMAKRAQERAIPVVSDLESIDTGLLRELAELANHFIIPAGMAAKMFGETDPAQALKKALRFGRKEVVCLTDGVNGSWYMLQTHPDRLLHQEAFRVTPVVDTNGCGDVFHGAYAASLVKGMRPEDCIKRASAAAALKVRKPGGQDGAPTLAELEAFLAEG